MQSSTSIDDDVLAARDDHVLLAVRDREVVLVVDAAAVAGVEPAVADRVGGLLGLLPVARPSPRCWRPAPRPRRRCESRTPNAGAPARPSFCARCRRREVVVLGAAPVHREQRRRLGEPVDLDELPTRARSRPVRSCGSAAARRPRRCACDRGPGCRRSTPARRRAPRSPPRARRTASVTPCCVDAPQDLGAVDLAQHDVPAAHARDRVGHAPAVAMEHRERVEIHVAVADTDACQPKVVALTQMLRCVICTPFGRAVVPLV